MNIEVGDILWDEGFRRVKILEIDTPRTTIVPGRGTVSVKTTTGAIKVIDVDEHGQPRKFEAWGTEYTSKPRYLNTTRNLRRKRRTY